MLGPQALQLSKGLRELAEAVDIEDLQAAELAARVIRIAAVSVIEFCDMVEISLFELKNQPPA